MLFISLGCSAAMLTVTCANVWWNRSMRSSPQIAWAFLVFLPFSSATYLLNLFLVIAVGLVWMATTWQPRVFYRWALCATFLSYAIGSIFGFVYVRDAVHEFPMESMAQRLGQEGRREETARRGGWALEQPPDEETLARLEEIEQGLEYRDYEQRKLPRPGSWKNRSTVLAAIHDAQVWQFVNSPGFGVMRLPLPHPAYAKPATEAVIPLESLDEIAAPMETSAEGVRAAHFRRRRELNSKSISMKLSEVAGFYIGRQSSILPIRVDSATSRGSRSRRGLSGRISFQGFRISRVLSSGRSSVSTLSVCSRMTNRAST